MVSAFIRSRSSVSTSDSPEPNTRRVRERMTPSLSRASHGAAGPESDERGNPVGLVYVALAAPEGCWVRKLNLAGPGDRRDRARTMAASHCFDMVLRYLAGMPVEAVQP